MWLLIDDIRDLKTEVIARTYEAGKRLLELGAWDCVIFDHDLGEKDDKRNGLELLRYGLQLGLLGEQVQLVTANPVGLQLMQLELLHYEYKTLDGRIFKKVS